jgi:type VI secretion system secreted protein VgrG
MFRFEDKQGSEQIKLHAERNYDTSVECNTTHASAGSHSIEVGLPLASGDSSTSAPPSGAQRLLQQQAGGASGGALQQAMRSMAATKPGKGRKKRSYAHGHLQQSTPQSSAAPQSTLLGQIPAFIQHYFDPTLGGSAYSVTVNGVSNALVLGASNTVVSGASNTAIIGESTTAITGLSNTVITGDQSTLNVGLVNAALTGNKVDAIVGNMLGVNVGLYESLHTADVTTTASVVGNAGNAVNITGNWVAITGSMITATGSSITNTGVTMAQVGYDVKM